jgi:hypothetical protein
MTVNQMVSRSSREGGAATVKGFKQLKPFFILHLHTKAILKYFFSFQALY